MVRQASAPGLPCQSPPRGRGCAAGGTLHDGVPAPARLDPRRDRTPPTMATHAP